MKNILTKFDNFPGPVKVAVYLACGYVAAVLVETYTSVDIDDKLVLALVDGLIYTIVKSTQDKNPT